MATAAAAAREAVPGVAVERQVAAGSPIEVLGAESRYAQLLVIGDRGLSRVEGLLAGSVAVAVAARSACPLVAVPTWWDLLARRAAPSPSTPCATPRPRSPPGPSSRC